MTDCFTYTRRQFLNTGMAFVSTIGSAPAFLSQSSLAFADTANKPGTPDDRVLLVVQLSGGNDGLNTVIPFADDLYHNARPNLRLPEKDIIKLDTKIGIGLHPQLQALHEMIITGRAAIVQGVGYPNPNRSHFTSMDIWHSGINPDDPQPPRLPRGTGWIGRAMEAKQTQTRDTRNGLACIALGSEAPTATQGQSIKPIAFDRPELFRWTGKDLNPAMANAYHQLQQAPPNLAHDDTAAYIFRTAMNAQIASDRVRQAVAHKTETTMPRTNLSRQLGSVANMIRAGLPTRVYYVAMGGFDTHANQLGQQSNLLREFAEGISSFYRELEATGQHKRVVTLAFSEFGRRVAQNASGGTDHGTAGPLFLFGDHLNTTPTGLVNDHPSLAHLDDGDLIYHTDFRSVYADLLKNWMHIDPIAALGANYKPTRLLRG